MLPNSPPNLSGLTAVDAECLAAEAERKRAAAAELKGLPAARLNAGTNGLDALVAAVRDPAAPGTSVFHVGCGGELAPRPDSDMGRRHRELAEAVDRMPLLTFNRP